MENHPTKSIHALLIYFGANVMLLMVEAPEWTFLIATLVLIWWIVRWEGDGREK
jgi:hypothetical protein